MSKLFVALEEVTLQETQMDGDDNSFFEMVEAERNYVAVEAEVIEMIDTVNNAVDELDNINKIQEIVKDGRETDTFEKLTEIAVEQIARRLGVRTVRSISTESIADMARNAIEAIKKFFKWIWEKIKQAYQYLRGLVVKFLQWIGFLEKKNEAAPDVAELPKDWEKKLEQSESQASKPAEGPKKSKETPSTVLVYKSFADQKSNYVDSIGYYLDIFEGVSGFKDCQMFKKEFGKLLNVVVNNIEETGEKHREKTSIAVKTYFDSRTYKETKPKKVLGYTIQQLDVSGDAEKGKFTPRYSQIDHDTSEDDKVNIPPLDKKTCDGILSRMKIVAKTLESDSETLGKIINGIDAALREAESEIQSKVKKIEGNANEEAVKFIVQLFTSFFKDYTTSVAYIQDSIAKCTNSVMKELGGYANRSADIREKAGKLKAEE